jgi:hypothetical protein
MTPELLLSDLGVMLSEPLKEMGVTLSIHGHEDDAMELLAVGPEQARLCLTMEDLTVGPGAQDQDCGVARMTFRALLQAPRDYQLSKQAQEVAGGGINGNVSLLTLATWVRTLMQRVLWDGRTDVDNVHGIRFLSQRRYAPDAQRGLRSLDLRFAVVIALDLPSADVPIVKS